MRKHVTMSRSALRMHYCSRASALRSVAAVFRRSLREFNQNVRNRVRGLRKSRACLSSRHFPSIRYLVHSISDSCGVKNQRTRDGIERGQRIPD
jgi:hypothetical protein